MQKNIIDDMLIEHILGEYCHSQASCDIQNAIVPIFMEFYEPHDTEYVNETIAISRFKAMVKDVACKDIIS